MTDHFRVRFEHPAAGSLPVTLTANNNSLSFITSHTPYDSLSELVSVLITILLVDTGHISIRWNTEPMQYVFRFAIDASAITLTVIQWLDSTQQHQNGQMIFVIEGSRLEIVLPFWRALRRLESRSTKIWEWQHPFPVHDMRKLDESIQQRKYR